MCANVQMYPLGKREELEAKWLGKPTEEWLKSYNRPATIRKNRRNMAYFCAWIEKNDVQLLAEFKQAADKEQWAKEMGKKLVEWCNWLLKNDYAVNSARAAVGDVRAFFTNQCRSVKIGRRKIPKQQVATGEHEFSQMDLQKMFHYADVRGKAVLSTAVSLGWSASDFLHLKRKEIEALVGKAISEKTLFIGFDHVRGKTGAVSRSHLTPEAVESLRAYLDITDSSAKYLWANGTGKRPFTNDTLNNIVRDLVEKAGVKTIGSVRFHLIRKYTMSTLSSAGIGDWDVKFMIGKEVPADIATYLINRKTVLMEEFQKAYPKLSLTGYANRNHDRLGQLEQENTRLKEQLAIQWQVIDMMSKRLEELDPQRKEKMAKIKELIKASRSKLLRKETD